MGADEDEGADDGEAPPEGGADAERLRAIALEINGSKARAGAPAGAGAKAKHAPKAHAGGAHNPLRGHHLGGDNLAASSAAPAPARPSSALGDAGGLALLARADTCPAFERVRAYVGGGYVPVVSTLMWQIGLLVLARADVAADVSAVHAVCEATGLMGITPNKGGVVATLRLRGTSLAFVASHLAAHMGHAEARNLNSVEILNNARLPPRPQIDADAQFDHVVWMGDLNYRLDLAIAEGGGAERGVETPERWAAVAAAVGAADWAALARADQLQDAQRAGRAFGGFKEGPLAFTPTFKVKREAGYAHSKQRVPSWCDRVLWKSLPALADDVACEAYTGHGSIATSDHKPVSAVLRVRVRPAPPPGAGAFAPGDKGLGGGAGALVRVTGLKGRGLLGMDLSGLSDVYVDFYSDRELRGGRDNGKAGACPKASFQRQTVDPSWGDDEVDEMRVAARDAADLKEAHLWLVLMDKDVSSAPDRMGQAVLPLGPAAAAGAAGVPFDVPVYKGAREQGRVSGRLHVTFEAPGKAHAPRPRKKTSWLCPCLAG